MGEGNKEVLITSVVEANNSQLVKIMDGCTSIQEYKSIYKFCNDSFKEFRRVKNSNNKIYMISESKINDNVWVITTIRNYEPEIRNNTKSMEISTQIKFNKQSLSTKGSSYYGGCNISEYKEFLSMLKDSIKYYKHI